MKVLSLFSGIGAFEKALDNIEKQYELVGFSEIDKYATKSYCVIHGVNESTNLGDITKIDENALPKTIDLVTYGFPCQDISLAGKQKGLFHEDGTQTRSGLFFEALRIIEETQPRVAIAENVKNLTSKKFSEQFKIVLEALEHAGYNNYWQVLNAKDYGIPQNRERVFIVSIRKDVDTGEFKFPDAFPLELKLKDLLEDDVDEKYFLSSERLKNVVVKIDTCSGGNRMPKVIVREATKKGYAEAFEGDSINLEQPNSKTRRGRVGKQLAQTLTTSCNQAVVEKIRIRRLTPKECFRLMGFTDSDFAKAESVNSNTQLYKQAGNSIVVNVVENLLKELLSKNLLEGNYESKNKTCEECEQTEEQERMSKGNGEERKEEKDMELKIYSPTEDGFVSEIKWNHEEIKKEVAEKVEMYKNLVYTDDQVKDAKADRAKLNKFVQALEAKRKEVKKQCLAPYEDFEKKMKEIVQIVNDPISLIDGQVREYEQKKKDEKQDKILEMFAESSFPEWVGFERIFEQRWLNASVSLKSIRESMEAKKEQIEKELDTLRILPEFAFEAEQVYMNTLDIQKSVNKAHEMAEIQKRKREYEAEQARLKAEAEAKKAEEEFAQHMNPPVPEQNEVVSSADVKEFPVWLAFKALLTTEDAFALKGFFDSRNIEFKPL